jgi:RNA polymerase sigma factor (sigma-70 family)
VSVTYASIGCQGYGPHPPVSGFCYGSMRFGSFYVAELESNRPAYFAHLLRFLRRKGRSREDAEDLIQEAMLRLHMYTHSVVHDKEAFLRRAVHNLAIDQIRRDRSGLRREVPIEEVDRENPLIALGPSPDRVLDSQQRLDELVACLDAVNSRTREIYVAHRLGYCYAEIADTMGVSKTTVKRHVARALAVVSKVRKLA